ncbi:vicilin-like seed storage protein At2g28490 [Diospyros lotus]|uniref:vicilin-like seed storage protein At2g28490 n=1 Tax=Diospyros lotus TaxID=55363 RepID=UPI00225AEDE8|nr:vicilin-like seed storage protein At2g28490 [Diospyros lotus]
MGKRRLALLLVALVLAMCLGGVSGFGGVGGWRRRRLAEGSDMFLLKEMKQVVKTDAGNMRVTRCSNAGGRMMDQRPMHIGFITMEPNSLFIPQYLDSNLILFVRRGEARVGSMHKDKMVDRNLKSGDVYRIRAGSAFYLVNTNDSKRLHIVCSIERSESWGWGTTQSFFLGGGRYPTSVLSGFDPQTLSTALNVSISELKDMMRRQESGPIIRLSNTQQPQSAWAQFLELKQHDRLQHLKRIVHFHDPEAAAATIIQKKQQPKWSLRGFLTSAFGKEANGDDDYENRVDKSSHPYNIYDRKPDFKNDYGSSAVIDGSDYSPLHHSGIALHLVRLKAGSIMAPHLNPRAMEYGVVLKGNGSIQIVYPNGSMAMNARVSEGDVFWVPQYFPFCQIASRSGPFEFFGFTTSSSKNRPVFLVGAHSLMQSMRGPEYAASFGVSEERLRRVAEAQRETVILPPQDAALMRGEGEHKEEMVIMSLGAEMVMGFD